MFRLYRFVNFFLPILFIAAVIDTLTEGGPVGGYFSIACLWSLVFLLYLPQSNKRVENWSATLVPACFVIVVIGEASGVYVLGKSLGWIIWYCCCVFFAGRCLWSNHKKQITVGETALCIGFTAVFFVDHMIGDKFHQHMASLHESASAPFDGSREEASQHFIGVWQLFGYLIAYAAGLIPLLIGLFPEHARSFWRQIRRLFIVRVRRNRSELIAYAVAGLVILVPEYLGLGPIVSTSIAMLVFLTVFYSLVRRWTFPLRFALNWALCFLVLCLFIPHHARLVERVAMLQKAEKASNEFERMTALNSIELPNLNDEELRSLHLSEAGKLGLRSLALLGVMGGVPIFWLNRGLSGKRRRRKAR